MLNIPQNIGIDELLGMLEFSEERQAKFNSMQDITPAEYPIFVTITEVLRLIDGCLKEPFLKRGEKRELKKEVSLGIEEEGKYFHVKNLKQKGYRRARLIDFDYFREVFWSTKGKKFKAVKSGGLYWREIMTYIKGSASSHAEQEGK